MDSDLDSRFLVTITSLFFQKIIQTAPWGLVWPPGFEFGFGFEAVGSGFRFRFKKKGVDSDSAGFGFAVPGFGFQMPGFAHH